MSGFFNETNYGRINKMCEMLDGPMMKSGKSNKATQEQWRELLDPLIQSIEMVCGYADPPEPKAQPEVVHMTKVGSKHPERTPQAILDGLSPEEMLNVAYYALLQIDQDIYDKRAIA